MNKEWLKEVLMCDGTSCLRNFVDMLSFQEVVPDTWSFIGSLCDTDKQIESAKDLLQSP